jgi:hypothetical protein
MSPSKSAGSEHSQLDLVKDLLVLSAGGLISLLIIGRIVSHVLDPSFASEFVNHSRLLPQLERAGAPLYSIWYLLQKLIVGSDLSENVLIASGIFLLGALAMLKGVILTGLLRSAFFSPLVSLIGGVLLGTAVALPIPFLQRTSPMIGGVTRYLGTIPANTFMSATQLVANLAAVIAFVAVQLWMRSPSRQSYGLMIVVSFIATMAKPGIALPLLFGIFSSIALSVHRSRGIIKPYSLQLILPALCLGLPILIIQHTYYGASRWQGLKAVLNPMHTWQAFSNQIPLDFVASIAFPLIVLLMLFLQLRNSECTESKECLLGLIPAWVTFISALAIFILFAETMHGSIVTPGNFIWGAISSNSGLHVVSFIALKQFSPRMRIIPIIILFLEAACGYIYCTNYAATGVYF